MTITNDIRQKFVDYFVKQGHTHVPSSPLVPLNDPTLMFTNSGMVQFKNYFTGAENPPFTRATTYQKSVRAGGKHNDLDNVGYTVRHHTFFEMLGNFSFGDYFKEDAIFFAWDLLTKELGIPKEKLYVTIFHNDEQAHDIWKKVAGLSEDRIIRIATKDNFWQMGEKFSMIMETNIGAVCPARRKKTAIGILKFGIWCLINLKICRMGHGSTSRNPALIQVPVWNG